MQNFENSVPFDPGYYKIAFSFTNEIAYTTGTFFRLKNPNQKRFELMKNENKIIEIIEKSTAFYLGCMLWGAFLSYRFKDSPKIIEGNTTEDYTEEEKQNLDCAWVVKDMLKYIELFDRDCKYYLKHPAKITSDIKDYLNAYIEFAKDNNNFLKTKNTSDIIPPKILKHFEDYDNSKLDELCTKIEEIIESKNIGKLLEIGVYK